MKTSRGSLDRMLDLSNPSLTAASLGKAAAALGRKVELRFVPALGESVRPLQKKTTCFTLILLTPVTRVSRSRLCVRGKRRTFLDDYDYDDLKPGSGKENRNPSLSQSVKASELDTAIRRKGKARKSVHELAKIVGNRSDDNPNYCLFLGSGASATSGIRTGGELVSEWRKVQYEASCDRLGQPIDSNADVETQIAWLKTNETDWHNPLHEYSSLFEQTYPLHAQRRKFIELEVSSKIPSIGYAYLVKLAESGLLRTTFTTNFDDLLNEAFYQFSAERPIVCAHDSSVSSLSITARRSKIVKLHGDYLFDDIKCAVNDTASLEENMRRKLDEFSKEYGLIIVGYSGSDKSIIDNLKRMLEAQDRLQNGVYWCFRSDDHVNDEVLSILTKHDDAFYVIIDGFDDLMADLYDRMVGKTAPFSSRIANVRASSIIDHYINNQQACGVKDGVVARHLRDLKKERNDSLITDALSSLNKESLGSSGLSDTDLLTYLDLEREIKGRNVQNALDRISREIEKATSPKFKEALLYQLYVCSQRLNKTAETKLAIDKMLEQEPQNFFVELNQCALLDSRSDRLRQLEALTKKAPYSAPVFNALAYEQKQARVNRDKGYGAISLEAICETYKKSTKIQPGIENPAWSSYLNFLLTKSFKTRDQDSEIKRIFEVHLEQDSFDSRTSSIFFRICKDSKKASYQGIELFQFLWQAYEMHFPRDYVSHARVIADACIEFDQYALLKKVLEESRTKEDVIKDPEFADLLIDVTYDVFRDLDGAIKSAENFLAAENSILIEQKLFGLLLDAGDTKKARACLEKLEGGISVSAYFYMEAELLSREGRFQDAIDSINANPDRKNFEERQTTSLTYLELKMERYDLAFERTRKYLDARGFSVYFDADIVNYEFAKINSGKGKKIDKARVEEVLLTSSTPGVEAICQHFLGDDKKCIEILKEAASKKYSRIKMFQRWPILKPFYSDLKKVDEDLVRSKRMLND